MSLYENFIVANAIERKQLLLTLIENAKAKRLRPYFLLELIKILSDKQYVKEYAPIIVRILFLNGEFRDNSFFTKILDLYLLKNSGIDKDAWLVLRNVLLREINIADNSKLIEYKLILESRGVKAGTIADFMAKQKVELKDYVPRPGKIVQKITKPKDYTLDNLKRVLAFNLRRKLLP